MTAVIHLLPGDAVLSLVDKGQEDIYVAQTVHPLWPTLQLTIWRMADGSWSHAALSPAQDVGEVVKSDEKDRTRRLRLALLGSAS